MKRWARGVSVFLRLLPFFIAFLRDRRRWIIVGGRARRRADRHAKRAERLADTIASLGPTFVKLAQLFSARADILPEPYLSEIGKLQDQVPPTPSDRIVRVIEEEMEAPISEIFSSFDQEPLAAASLGQVHRATVGDRELVVKVLRPGVEEIIALDLDISFRLLLWLNILFPNQHVRALSNVVREFSVQVRRELDFVEEAKNIRRFRRVFRGEPRVRAPEVVESFTRRRVLVMEHCPGTKIDGLRQHFDSGRLDFDEIMEGLTGLYLRMMMVDGFLHADPHPGNLLVQEDGTIVVLDWGMVLDVPRWTREGILKIALAVEAENLDLVINEMYRMGMISQEMSRGEIREAAQEIMKIVERVRAPVRDRLQETIREIFDTFYTWPLILPQELVYFFRAAALLEGVGLRYDPHFDGLDLIRRVIRSHRPKILREVGKEPMVRARDMFGELDRTLRSLRDLLTRADREELRVRVHPRDVQGQERFLHLQARRLLLSIFASATAVISSIVFVSVQNLFVLGVGLAISLLMFLIVLVIPTHLLENPLRHARGIRPGEWRR